MTTDTNGGKTGHTPAELQTFHGDWDDAGDAAHLPKISKTAAPAIDTPSGCVDPNDLTERDKQQAAQREDFGLMSAVLEILDGKDTGEGFCIEPWESIRRRLIEIVAAQPVAQAVPVASTEIDYQTSIAYCYKTLGHAQGTKGCIAFARGAEWMFQQFPVAAPPPPKALTDALRWAIREIDLNTCTHEETHRGGSIWTICDACGKRWADDEGGFKPYVEPKELAGARAILAAAGEKEKT